MARQDCHEAMADRVHAGSVYPDRRRYDLLRSQPNISIAVATDCFTTGTFCNRAEAKAGAPMMQRVDCGMIATLCSRWLRANRRPPESYIPTELCLKETPSSNFLLIFLWFAVPDHRIRSESLVIRAPDNVVSSTGMPTNQTSGFVNTGPFQGTYASSASKIFRHSGMTVAFKTTFEVFTRVGPDNSLERLTERSVGLVTDRPSDVYELFVTLFE